MEFDRAETRLSLTWNPNWLYVTNRAFYYIIKGTLLMNRKQIDEAKELFQRAASLKLPSEQERAMVLLQLANISANKGKWAQAKGYFMKAKKLKVTESALKDQMKQFEKNSPLYQSHPILVLQKVNSGLPRILQKVFLFLFHLVP